MNGFRLESPFPGVTLADQAQRLGRHKLTAVASNRDNVGIAYVWPKAIQWAMAERSLLPQSDGWVLVLENHADGYAALVFCALIFRNRGNVPLFYSSHMEAPELSHSILAPGKSVGVITRHLMVRAEGGDGEFEIEMSGLTAISSN